MTREVWLDAALEALREGGVESVRVEPLARRLGVTKGNFYRRFRDRDDLLEAMLEYWRELDTEFAVSTVGALPDNPPGKLRALARLIADNPLTNYEVAFRIWAGHDERASRALNRIDEERRRFISTIFAEAGFSRTESRQRADLWYFYAVGEFMVLGPDGARESRSSMLDLVVDSLFAEK